MEEKKEEKGRYELDYNKTVEQYIGKSDWRVKENSTVNYSIGGLILGNSGAITANYWLNRVYPKEVADGHRDCLYHLHDLCMLSAYCAGWSLKQLITEGLGGIPGKIASAPAKHLSTLCNQMVNFLGILQNEWAGAQAFSSFDTYLAPFVKEDHLSYEETKHCIESFIYGVNIPSRWGTQAPFSNITLDWVCPKDLAEQYCIVGGKLMDYKYRDCQKEMDMVNKAFLEVMNEGDANGRGFQYPIPTYSITRDFDWSDTENNRLLFEMAAKYGTPYFSNYVNSDMNPSDVRSMCPLYGDEKVLVKNDKGWKVISASEAYRESASWTVLYKGQEKAAHMRIFTGLRFIRVSLEGGQKVIFSEEHINVTRRGNIMTSELVEGDMLPYETDVNEITGLNCGMKFPKAKTDDDGFVWMKVTGTERIETEDSVGYCFAVKDGTKPYFVLPSGLVTHNCRLRLDLRELRRKNGGFFGSGESTGSIGVVTLNMPHIAYMSADEPEFWKNLARAMDLAAESLDVKRKFLEENLARGLYPYTKHYLGTFANHFSTIGLIGMNECCLNAKWIRRDLLDRGAQDFTVKVLEWMKARLVSYQEKYGALFNLEATPAESTSYRLAKHDRERWPDIITAGTKDSPFYTNSSHLPVNSTDDVFDALNIEDRFQPIYTSGTVFHTFLGEKLPSWKSAATLVRKICFCYKMPYITLSPTYSVCPEHGYLSGAQDKCPICGKETEIYSRITGYYRPVKNWNAGKAEEFRERKTYDGAKAVSEPVKGTAGSSAGETGEDVPGAPVAPAAGDVSKVVLFGTKTCPNCLLVRKELDAKKIPFTYLCVGSGDASADSEAERLGIDHAPTLVLTMTDGTEKTVDGLSDVMSFAKTVAR